MDAPDDVYYKATAITKKLRKKLPVVQLRRAARKPFKKVITIPGAITPIITPPLSVVPLSIPQSFPQSIPQSMPATIPAVLTN
jgi:hypothetical protein